MTEVKTESYINFSNSNFQQFGIANNDLFQTTIDSTNVNYINEGKPVSSASSGKSASNVRDKSYRDFERLDEDDVTQIVQCSMLEALNQTWFNNEKPDEEESGEFIFKAINNRLTLAAKGIKDIKELGTGAIAHRLINALLIEFTQRRLRTITITRDELMRLFGIENTKYNKKAFANQIKQLLALLDKIWLSFEVKKKQSRQVGIKKSKKKASSNKTKAPPLWMQSFFDRKFCDSCNIKNGVVTFELTEFFHSYLVSCNFMATFKSIFKLDLKLYKHAPYIANKLLSRNNFDKIKAEKAKNNSKSIISIISVEKLLPSSPFFKSLIAGNLRGKGKERIIEPFEKSIDALPFIKSWHYCEKSRLPLSDKKLEDFNYQVFSRLYIQYEITQTEND